MRALYNHKMLRAMLVLVLAAAFLVSFSAKAQEIGSNSITGTAVEATSGFNEIKTGPLAEIKDVPTDVSESIGDLAADIKSSVAGAAADYGKFAQETLAEVKDCAIEFAKDFVDLQVESYNDLKNTASEFIEFERGMIGELKSEIVSAAEDEKQLYKEMCQDIKDAAIDYVVDTKKILTEAGSELASEFKSAFMDVKDTAVEFGTDIINFQKGIYNGLKGAAKFLANFRKESLREMWRGVIPTWDGGSTNVAVPDSIEYDGTIMRRQMEAQTEAIKQEQNAQAMAALIGGIAAAAASANNQQQPARQQQQTSHTHSHVNGRDVY